VRKQHQRRRITRSQRKARPPGRASRRVARTTSAGFPIAALFLFLLVFAFPAEAARRPRPELPALNQSGFTDPCGTATDSEGDLYVADYTNRAIKIYSPAGAALAEFTAAANSEAPCSLAVDSAGNVYADGWGSDVVKYKPSAYPPASGTTYAPDTAIDGTGTLVPGAKEATSVAVDPADDHVFVAEAGSHVSEYSPNGTLLSATIGEGVALGHSYYGVDVDGATGNVYLTDLANSRAYVLDPTGTSVLTTIDGTAAPAGEFEFAPFVGLSFLAVDQSNGNVLVSDVAAHGVVEEFSEDGEYVATIENTPAFADAEPSDIAVDNGSASPNQGDVYVSSIDGTVYAFGALPVVGLKLEVKKTGPGSGTVTSSPAAINCGGICEAKFPPGAKIALTATAAPGSKFKSWSGCDGVAGDQCEVTLQVARSVTAAFSAPPTIDDEAVTQLSTSAATLGAHLSPSGEATTYHFEYGDQGPCGANACVSIPVPDASAGSSLGAASVSRTISGLKPGTGYHFRLIAANPTGTTIGADAIFTTYQQIPPIEACPNDSLRSGPSEKLADCRAYEQVSPLDKNGADVTGGRSRVQASVNGDAITFFTQGGLPGGVGAQDFPLSLGRRVSGNWSTAGLLPPASLGASATIDGWTPDLSQVFTQAAPAGSGATASLYVRNSADGSLTTITDKGGGFVAGSSADGSTVYFQSQDQLTADATPGRPNLYAWDRETNSLTLAGVLPDSACATPPCVPAQGSLAPRPAEYTKEPNVISSDGGSAYFNDAGSGQLYLRLDAAGPDPETVQVSASARTEGQGPYGADSSGAQPASFQAASADGSTAFFTSPELLTNDATTGPESPPAAIGRAKLGASGAEEIDHSFLPAHATAITTNAGFIYWIDAGEGTVGRAQLNGEGDATEVQDAFLTNVGHPVSLAVGNGYVYWTNRAVNGDPAEYSIGRAQLDGSGPVEPKFIGGTYLDGAGNPAPVVGRPIAIAVDGAHIYWSTELVGIDIARADLSGNEVETGWAYVEAAGTIDGLAVGGDHIYFTLNNPASFLGRINDDGSGMIFRNVAGEASNLQGITVDPEHVYWVNPADRTIGRIDLGLTQEGEERDYLTGVENGAGIAIDGSHLYWSENGLLTAKRGGDLYRFVSGKGLSDITVDPNPADYCPGTEITCGAQVLGVLGAAEDGSYLYFAANGVLSENAGAGGSHATVGDCVRGQLGGGHLPYNGTCNLYAWHDDGSSYGATEYIAPLDTNGTEGEYDALNWESTGIIQPKTARVSAGGRILVFRSQLELTGYNTHGVVEFYRYDAVGRTLTCITCNPTGAPPTGAPDVENIDHGPGFPQVEGIRLTRNLSASGNRFFFQTPDKLIASDTNGDQGCPMTELGSGALYPSCLDVYEWEATGAGTCHRSSEDGGCFFLISTGTGSEPAFFADASLSGGDAFFFTRDRLVPQDGDGIYDLYDASADGGLAAQHAVPAPPCEGDSCRTSGTSSAGEAGAASATFFGPQKTSQRPPCRKHKRRVKGRCIARHQRHHRAKHHRRAHR
jgi:DNA-binding beta-propeller fold protein YncE